MDFSKEVKASLNHIEDVIHDIEADVFFDGVVTTEENKLLRTIFNDIDEFHNVIHQALEDDQVTQSELDQLKLYKSQILSNAELIANSDDIVSRDEFNILASVTKFLRKLSF